MRDKDEFLWDAMSCHALKLLWATALTTSEIAEKISPHLTKNSVIGKARRLNLPLRKKSPHREPLRRARYPSSPGLDKRIHDLLSGR